MTERGSAKNVTDLKPHPAVPIGSRHSDSGLVGLPDLVPVPLEMGALVLTVLAWPECLDDRRGFTQRQNALCACYIRQRSVAADDWARSPSQRATYLLQDVNQVNRYAAQFDRRIEHRLLAAKIAIPLLREAAGLPIGTPAATRNLSIAGLIERVIPESSYGDVDNFKRDVWRPSGPVLHIAVAALVAAQTASVRIGSAGFPPRMFEDMSFINGIVALSEEYAELFARSPKLMSLSAKLIRLAAT